MKQRIDHIDGLRGVAVLAVVLFHAGVHNSVLAAAPGARMSLFLRHACHGVDLFFVLSGFCLAFPALARLHSSGHAAFSISGYAARRIIRIVPPYYAAIVLLVCLGGILTAVRIPFEDFLSKQALTGSAVLKQLFFLDGNRTFLDGSFWTLAIEFRWYFAFPILFLIWNRSPKAFAAIGLAALTAVATRLYSVDVFFFAALYARHRGRRDLYNPA